MIKQPPVEPCVYKKDSNPRNRTSPRLQSAGCCSTWLVLQENYHYCPFCGKPIEREPFKNDGAAA